MNNTYKLVVRPRLHFVVPGRGPLLTEGMVLEALTDVVIHELSEDELGNRTLHVELHRESDAEALDALVLFVERLGFSVLEATVRRDAWGIWSFHQRQSPAGGIQPEISPG